MPNFRKTKTSNIVSATGVKYKGKRVKISTLVRERFEGVRISHLAIRSDTKAYAIRRRDL